VITGRPPPRSRLPLVVERGGHGAPRASAGHEHLGHVQRPARGGVPRQRERPRPAPRGCGRSVPHGAQHPDDDDGVGRRRPRARRGRPRGFHHRQRAHGPRGRKARAGRPTAAFRRRDQEPVGRRGRGLQRPRGRHPPRRRSRGARATTPRCRPSVATRPAPPSRTARPPVSAAAFSLSLRRSSGPACSEECTSRTSWPVLAAVAAASSPTSRSATSSSPSSATSGCRPNPRRSRCCLDSIRPSASTCR